MMWHIQISAILLILAFIAPGNSLDSSCNKIKIDPETVRYQKLKLYNDGQNNLNYVKQIQIGEFTTNINSKSISENLEKYLPEEHSVYLLIAFEETLSDSISADDYQTLVNSNVIQILDNGNLVIMKDKQVSLENDETSLGSSSSDATEEITTLDFFLHSNKQDDILKAENIAEISLYFFSEDGQENCDFNINVPPKFSLTLEEQEETKEGITGKVVLEAEWSNGQSKKYHLNSQITPQLQRRICHSFGYHKAKKIANNEKQSGLFDLDQGNCLTIFRFYLNSDLHGYRQWYMRNVDRLVGDRREDRNNFCLNEKKRTVLYLECSHKLTSYKSYALFSNSCNGQSNCPLGYYPKDDICVPKTCHCSHGIPVESNFEYIRDSCGLIYTTQHDLEELAIGQLIDSENEEFKDASDMADDLNGLDDDFSDFDRDGSRRNSRMKGGTKISKTDMPFQAYLYRKNEIGSTPHCSSAILNPRFVITAAHCCFNGNRVLGVIYVTDTFLPGTPKIHDSYIHSGGSKAEDLIDISKSRNDIALIRIQTTKEVGANTLRFSKTIRPICLSDHDDLAEVEMYVTGKPVDDSEQDLHILEMKELDMSECDTQSEKNSEGERGTKEENVDPYKDLGLICAGHESKECKTTTKGDSGGPLMTKKLHLIDGGSKFVYRWELVGIVSAGADTDCVDKNDSNPDTDRKPFSLFTSVAKHALWISQVIRQDNYQGGRFCAYDDTVDCATCDEGYSLQGKSCVENFSINRLNSLSNFFDDNYCSDNCVNFMTSKKKCKYNVCKCTNGEANRRCLKPRKQDGMLESCNPDKCNNQYQYNKSTGACEKVNIDITDLDSITSYLAKDCSEEHSKEVASDDWCGRLSVLDPNIINYNATMDLIRSDYLNSFVHRSLSKLRIRTRSDPTLFIQSSFQ